MSAPIKDFDGIAKGCLIVGGVFGLIALNGVFAEDPAIELQKLKASGMTLPITIPSAVNEYHRLFAALELIPYLLLVGVGWSLQKKKPWSVSALKGVAWLLLIQGVAGALWMAWEMRPSGAPEEPLQSAARILILGSSSVMTVVWTTGLAWLLWRLRGAGMEPQTAGAAGS